MCKIGKTWWSKKTAFLFLACMLLPVFPSYSKSKAKANELIIQFQCPLSGEEIGSLSWENDGSSYKDTFDSVSGASTSSATRKFSALCSDSSKKKRIPSAFVKLMLYAVNSPSARSTDNLTAEEGEDGVITITFVHRGTAYRITTGKNGELTAGEGEISACETSQILCDNKGGLFEVKEDFRKEGATGAGLDSLDWEKVTFTKEKVEGEKVVYTGKINFSIKEKVLYAKGKLSYKAK